MSLYRKYRPRTFADVVGQQSVTRGLLGSLRTDALSHAYLFTGPRGSGKTTTARLLSKAVNCKALVDGEPCNVCETCELAMAGRLMDVIELDAASNRGIDEIRQLREQVAFAPSQGRYKTYILDEVHMLTKDAANAFLKTLEEPPRHVIFVLATTEAHKVMGTIASRCQRYDFQRIPLEAAAARLRQVLAAESIDRVSPKAIEEIVRRGDGSLRDMLGLLEQVLTLSDGAVEADDVRVALGLARDRQIESLAAAILDRLPADILSRLQDLHDAGIEPQTILAQLLEWLRERLMTSAREAVATQAAGPSQDRLVALLSRLSALVPSLRQALAPLVCLEIGLLDAAHAELISGREELLRRIEDLDRTVLALRRGIAAGEGRPDPAAGSGFVAPAAGPEPRIADSPDSRSGRAVRSPESVPGSSPFPGDASTLRPFDRLRAQGSGPGAIGGAPDSPEPASVAEAAPPGSSGERGEAPALGDAPAEPFSEVEGPPPVPRASSKPSRSREPKRPPAARTRVREAAPPADSPEDESLDLMEPGPFPGDEEGGDTEFLREASEPAAAEDSVAAGAGDSDGGPLDLQASWSQLLDRVRREKPQTWAFAVEGRPAGLQGKKLRILFASDHQFHLGKLKQPEHEALLRKCVKEVFGSSVTPVLEQDAGGEGAAPSKPLEKDWARKQLTEDKTVQLIKEMFNGDVVDLE